MHLTRLSRIETVPSPHQPQHPTAPNPSRPFRLLAHLITLAFLTSSVILIFISLLLPNTKTHLSSMVMRPVNKICIPATLISASTSSEKPLATGMWGQDETDIQPSVRQRGVEDVTWFGINGPEVWVGPMQICSRSDKNSEVVCTSSSTPAFHARVLPFNLSDSLLALPTKPTSPILLLITGICILLGTMVHSFSLSNVGSCRGPLLRSKTTNNSEESLTINTPKPRRGPHLAFSFLVGAGSVLSIAAAAVERRSVNDALDAWDVGAGASVGLEASMGVLAHIIPLIPFFLLLSLISSYAPLFIPTSTTNPPIEAGAEVRGRAEISGLFAHVTDSGKKLSDGKPVFAEIDPGTPRSSVAVRSLPEIVVVPAKKGEDWEVDEKIDIDGGEGMEVPRSAASCRTFGVGEAC